MAAPIDASQARAFAMRGNLKAHHRACPSQVHQVHISPQTNSDFLFQFPPANVGERLLGEKGDIEIAFGALIRSAGASEAINSLDMGNKEKPTRSLPALDAANRCG